MRRIIIHQGKYGNHEDASVQIRYPQIQLTDYRMGEPDLHLWLNLFINWEAKIQPLPHLIITILQGLYGDQEE